jgi:hypothetical protein
MPRKIDAGFCQDHALAARWNAMMARPGRVAPWSVIGNGMPLGSDPTGMGRFSLATDAKHVCAEIMLNQKPKAR